MEAPPSPPRSGVWLDGPGLPQSLSHFTPSMCSTCSVPCRLHAPGLAKSVLWGYLTRISFALVRGLPWCLPLVSSERAQILISWNIYLWEPPKLSSTAHHAQERDPQWYGRNLPTDDLGMTSWKVAFRLTREYEKGTSFTCVCGAMFAP
jgi:hypothetical protein